MRQLDKFQRSVPKWFDKIMSAREFKNEVYIEWNEDMRRWSWIKQRN